MAISPAQCQSLNLRPGCLWHWLPMLVPAGPGSFAGHWAQLPRPQVQSIQSLYVWAEIPRPGCEGRGKSLWLLRYKEHGSGVSLTGPVRPWREPRHMSFLVPPCFQAFGKWYRRLVAKSLREEPDIAGVEQSWAQQQLCCELRSPRNKQNWARPTAGGSAPRALGAQ